MQNSGDRSSQRQAVKTQQSKFVMDGQGAASEERSASWESSRTVQIFVTVENSKAELVDVAISDKVRDVVRRSVRCCNQDVYVICEGRMPRKDDELMSFALRDGGAVQIASRLRGGGKQKDKKSRSEKKQAKSPKKSQTIKIQQEEKSEEEPKSDEGPVMQRLDEEEVIRQLGEQEGYQIILDCVSQASERRSRT